MRRDRRGAPATATGELVALSHVDLETIVETIRFLRDAGRGHLLDTFNRGPVPPCEPSW